MPRPAKKAETTPTVRAKRTRRASDTRAAAPAVITDVEISRLAYQLYQARGGANGSPVEDWLQAERQLTGS